MTRMSLANSSSEIRRLIDAFEAEAAKFHEIEFRTFFITQAGVRSDRKFSEPNHAIMLWQYYGLLKADADLKECVANLLDSDLKWGLRGAALTLFGAIEGAACPLFVRMAMRAGALFDESDARTIKSRVVTEIQKQESENDPNAKPLAAVNDNPLAIWLNFLLYHLSMTYPGRQYAQKIEPDPFSLSLLALERLFELPRVEKIDRSSRKLDEIRFKVALTFPGEKRRYVSKVADALRGQLGWDSVFYDFDYQAQLARPNLDTLLQGVYLKQSDLIVVFL